MCQSVLKCDDTQRRSQWSRAVARRVNRGHEFGQAEAQRARDFVQHIPERRLECDACPMASERETAFDQASQDPAPGNPLSLALAHCAASATTGFGSAVS